jgi:hypothetical protein
MTRTYYDYRSESLVHLFRGGQLAVGWCRWWDSQVEFRIVLDHLCKKYF